MSKPLLAAVAAAFAVITPAAAVEYADIRNTYSSEAFADADDQWRRITANRHDSCSRYGKERKTRVGLLVDSYLAIGDALDANDEAATMKATKRLSRAINLNGRFEDCWDTISRRAGVTREFQSMLDDI